MKYFNSPDINEEEHAEINMSPLVDMVFLLLIFFMVTTVFVKETGVKVKRPQASTAEALSQTSILLSLTASGQVFYGGRSIPLSQLPTIIQQALGDKDLPVTILADTASSTGQLVQVIDQCKRGGAQNVSVAAAAENTR